jgi:hypothetical protein
LNKDQGKYLRRNNIKIHKMLEEQEFEDDETTSQDGLKN